LFLGNSPLPVYAGWPGSVGDWRPSRRRCSPPSMGWRIQEPGRQRAWCRAGSMAWVCLRHGRMVPGLSDLPERKGDVAAAGGDAEHPGSRAVGLPSPCGFGGASPPLGGGVQISFHRHRPVHQVRGAIPVNNMEAATIADALVAGWISRFGVPAVITSDRGTQFTSAVWEVLCKRLNIQHITTTAFHPCRGQLKDLLQARSAANNWPDPLLWVLLAMRAAPKEDSAVSSAEMVLGDLLVLPGQLPTAEPPPLLQRSYRDTLVGGYPVISPRGPCRQPIPGSQQHWQRTPACTSGEAATCRRCRRCMLGRMRCWSEVRRCSGCRWGTERRQCQWTA
jgi:hypothetical protein